MKISSVENSFIDALKSLKRNRSLSFASIATVAATLFIFGVFLLIQVNLDVLMKGVEDQLEVRVTLSEKITKEQQASIESTLNNIKGVKTVTLETNEEAYAKLQKTFGENNKSLLIGLDKAKLPFTFVVKVDKPEYTSEVVIGVKNLPGVDEVRNAKDVVNSVITISKTIKLVGFGIFIILLTVSFFLIGNTIKLTVYSRRREIGIMKYIGATDWFIRAPFIIEGVLLGVFGAIISDMILYFLYGIIVTKVGVSVGFLQFVSAKYVLNTLLIEFLFIGSVIGCLGSVFAVRKFLVV